MTTPTDVTKGQQLDERYKESLRHLAETKSSFIFPNSNPGHASLVIEALIEHSQHVRIFEEKLNADLLHLNDGILDAIEKKLNGDGGSVYIVIADGVTAEHGAISKLKSLEAESKGRLRILKASTFFTEEVVRYQGKMFHFAVGDSTSFRVEDPSTPRKAMCSFNRPVIAKPLFDLFEEASKGCYKYFA